MTTKIIKHLPIVGILLLAFFSRFWRLGTPDTYYFDEVYHAFTAKEMLLGNPAAWEFWNTPPVGFAYEWTHPPLAKLFMALGMIIFGIDPFGWRFFGATAGVGVILLVYFLSLELFKDKFIATIAAFLLVFETLIFVEARIGMNDSYFLLFILLSLLFLIKKRYIIAGIFWGFALATKWTALYGIFIFSLFFAREYLFINALRYKYIIKYIFFIPVFFIIIPVIIYVSSYAPFFFLSDPNIPSQIDSRNSVIMMGRSVCLPIFPAEYCDKLAIVWNVQQQMFWYHTNLKAIHSYQSLWYTWPFDIKPVYYYVGNFGDRIAQIYAMGNPIILWAGIPAIIFAIYRLIKKSKFNLGLVLTCYLAFWLPWSLSPRIMFIYHYLPSIPFLTILIAFALREFWGGKIGKILVLSYLFLVVLAFVYFYPHVAAWPVPTTFNNSYFWFSSWR